MKGTSIGRRIALAMTTLAASSIAAAASSEQNVKVAPGVELRVVSSGPKDGSAVVFIPGWGMTADVWTEQMARLQDRYRVISFDPRSQGKSTKTAYGMTPEQRARDLDRLLQSLRIDHAFVVAWSQGVQDLGAYVLQFGTGRLQGAVLVDAAFSPGATPAAQAPARMATELQLMNVLLADPDAYAEGMLDVMTAKPLDAAQRARIKKMITATPPAMGAAAILSSRFARDRSQAAAALDKPVLVLSSPTSPDIASQKAMAAALRCGKLEEVLGTGHAVFLDEPQSFAERLERFLRSPGSC